MGRYTIRQVYPIKRHTVHLALDTAVLRVTFVIHNIPRLKPRVQWSPLGEPKQLGSGVDFTICTAHDAAAPLRRAREFTPSLHRSKDGPTLQGDWSRADIGSRLRICSESGSDIEHH